MAKTKGESKIISLRIKMEEAAKLNDVISRRPIVGVNSIEQFVRKLVLDFNRGALVYLNQHDKVNNPLLNN